MTAPLKNDWLDGQSMPAAEFNKLPTQVNVNTAAIGAIGILPVSGAVGDGVADDRGALVTADTAAMAAGSPITLAPGTYRVATSLTVNALVTFSAGAVIKPDSGATVTLAGGLDAPLRKIFDHSTGGLVVPKRVDFYHPAWWGPVNTANDTQTWLDMAAANLASRVIPISGVAFGQRIMAPVGINRIIDVSLRHCEVFADQGTVSFRPPSGTTSGTILTLEDYVHLHGGWFGTDEAGQAVTCLHLKGYRAQADTVYVANVAANSVGILMGLTTQSSTSPVLNNVRMMPGDFGVIPAAGSIGVYIQSSDAQLTNVWVAQEDTGIRSARGAGRWANVHVWGCNTGISGSGGWDQTQVTNLYLDSNRGWGMDIDTTDRAYFSGIYAWNNGHAIAGTGAIRLLRPSGSAQRSQFLGVQLNDNVGHGIYIDGPADYEIEAILCSSEVQAGHAVVTTTGVEVTSRTLRLLLRLRGSDAVTPLVNNSTTAPNATILMANLDVWAAKAAPTGTVVDTALWDAAQAAQGVNLASDPGFDYAPFWTTPGTGVALSTAQKHSGTQSLALTGKSRTAWLFRNAAGNGSSTVAAKTVRMGQVFRFSAMVYRPSGNTTAGGFYLESTATDSTGVNAPLAPIVNYFAQTGIATDTWLLYTALVTVPAGYDRINFRFSTTSSVADADVFYFDSVTISPSPLSGTASLDFGSIAALSHLDLTIATAGAVTGDSVALGIPAAAMVAGVTYTAWVSAADTVTVRAHNYTAGAVDPPSGAFKAAVVR